jgi:hypothetical protein
MAVAIKCLQTSLEKFICTVRYAGGGQGLGVCMWGGGGGEHKLIARCNK